MRGRALSEIAGNPAEVFLEFGYSELRWLAVSFVFLASLFLICSIFSLGRKPPVSKLVSLGIIATWGLFFLAIVRAGHGLWDSYQIAESLLLKLNTRDHVPQEYGYYVRSTYWILDTAGGLFILGLAAYVGTHVLALFLGRKKQPEALNSPG